MIGLTYLLRSGEPFAIAAMTQRRGHPLLLSKAFGFLVVFANYLYTAPDMVVVIDNIRIVTPHMSHRPLILGSKLWRPQPIVQMAGGV